MEGEERGGEREPLEPAKPLEPAEPLEPLELVEPLAIHCIYIFILFH